MANLLQCRVCKKTNNHVFSWSKKMYAFKNITFGDCYEEVTQLSSKMNETELPQSICFNCAKDLKTTYEFLKKARKSDREFRAALTEKNVKKKFEWVAVQKCEFDNNNINHILDDNEEHLDNYDDKTEELQVDEHGNSVDVEENLNNNNNNQQNAIFVVLNQFDYYDDDDDDNDNDNDNDKDDDENVSNVVDTYEIKEFIEEQLESEFEEIIPDAIENEKIVNETHNKICPHCLNEFADSDLPKHIANEHNHKKILCEECPRYFRDNHHLRRHQVVHERNRKPKFDCDICGRKFLTLGIFQGHLKTHDENRKRKYECDECDKAFYHKPSLRLHKQRHAGIALECQFCKKRCLRPIDLEIHIRRHTGEFPFKCDTCDKGFVTRSLLVRHLETHKGMRFSCDICGKEYSHKTSLRQHCKVHTGLPLKCGICEKPFERNSKVRRHLLGVHKIEDCEDLDDLVIDVSTGAPYKRQTIV